MELGPFFDEDSDKTLQLSDPRVLLIEDDPVTRWMVRLALKGSCVLSTAPDAGKAISAYHACQPDLVLLDIGLPGRDGKDLLSHLMRMDPGAYVVMFSSQDTAENLVETVQKGAKGFITKPFHREDILKHVSSCPLGQTLARKEGGATPC